MTIKYKNIKWTVSCSNTDLEGHKNKKAGRVPHYHISMVVSDLPFISFNSFHIPLTEKDILRLKVRRGDYSNHQHSWLIPGMNEILSLKEEEIKSELLDKVKRAEDEKEAHFDVSTILFLDKDSPRKKIKEAISKSFRTGEPLGKCLYDIKEAKVSLIIGPGKGIPPLKKKESRGKKR